MNQLPPLKALRVFESAGRLLSFTQAAEELNVTPGAISQQIRLLEDFLQIKLFKRLNRQIVLTDAGQLFLPMVSLGFDQLIDAVQAINRLNCDGPLTVTSPPSFVSKWLIPRLDKFKLKFPEINVRIDASERLVDFIREDIDVGIRFGTGEFSGLDVVRLFSFDLIPVCSPKILQPGKELLQPSDLARHTLLHGNYEYLDPSWPTWSMWLATAGVAGLDASHGIYFNQADMLLEAAIEGQGVGLVGSVVAAADIQSGRLVQPFETRIPARLDYHLVTSPQKAGMAKVKAFRDWIVEESEYLRS